MDKTLKIFFEFLKIVLIICSASILTSEWVIYRFCDRVFFAIPILALYYKMYSKDILNKYLFVIFSAIGFFIIDNLCSTTKEPLTFVFLITACHTIGLCCAMLIDPDRIKQYFTMPIIPAMFSGILYASVVKTMSPYYLWKAFDSFMYNVVICSAGWYARAVFGLSLVYFIFYWQHKKEFKKSLAIIAVLFAIASYLAYYVAEAQRKDVIGIVTFSDDKQTLDLVDEVKNEVLKNFDWVDFAEVYGQGDDDQYLKNIKTVISRKVDSIFIVGDSKNIFDANNLLKKERVDPLTGPLPLIYVAYDNKFNLPEGGVHVVNYDHETIQKVLTSNLPVIDVSTKTLQEIKGMNNCILYLPCSSSTINGADRDIIAFAKKNNIVTFACSMTSMLKGASAGKVFLHRELGKEAGKLLVKNRGTGDFVTDKIEFNDFIITASKKYFTADKFDDSTSVNWVE